MMTGHSTDNEIIDIVDEEDNVVGQATRRKVHQRGLMHRAVHIFVFNSRGEVYVQRRSDNKDKHPGVLDSSAAGHVDTGESYDVAAARELVEELGLQAEILPVFKVRASPVTDMEHVTLYRAVTDAPPVPDEEEISWGAFMAPDELSHAMESDPADFVPAFVYLWTEYERARNQCRT